MKPFEIAVKEGHAKAVITIDAVLALLIIGLEILIFCGYKKRKQNV